MLMPILPESSNMNLVLPLSCNMKSSVVVRLMVNEDEAVMVVSWSIVILPANSSKSRELEARPTPQDKVPEPFVFNTFPFDPSALGHVYLTPLNVVVPEIEAYPPTSRLLDTEAKESTLAPPSTSNLPVIRRSSLPERKEDVVVFVPNLE